MTKAFELLLDMLGKHFGKRGSKIVICLILMAFGIRNSEIRAKFGTSYDSLRKYRSALECENIDPLFVTNNADSRMKSELLNYDEQIMNDFNENPPSTVREAQTRIEAITGVKRNLTRIRAYLKKKGLKNRAVGFLPAKADPEMQRDYLDNTLNPLIEKAENGQEELYFLDASHFVMGAFAGRVWSVVRKWVKTACGRKRFNVLGALNYVTKKMETVVNDTYITSTEVIAMLEKLASIHVGRIINIVLDNARYQHCNAVTGKAIQLGINLYFLPTYSPNLNLIERVWKLVKSRVLNAAYTETFQGFCGNISSFIDCLHTSYLADMKTLITNHFHIVDTKNIIGTTILCR